MRIKGITIPENKQLEFGLPILYGIGRSNARSILLQVGVNPAKKPGEVTPAEEQAIRTEIEKRTLEGDLKRAVAGNINIVRKVKDRFKVDVPDPGDVSSVWNPVV